MALGLVHGVSFSASYQLVSRFAGKNTISLGLGCVGSGGIVLLLELLLRLGSNPSYQQNVVLYLVCAGAAPRTPVFRAQYLLLGFRASTRPSVPRHR